MKAKFWKGFLIGALSMFLLSTVFHFVSERAAAEKVRQSALPVNMEEVERTVEGIRYLVDQSYLFEDQIDPEEAKNGMYRGLVDGLNDKYSVYYSPEDLESFMENTNGSYCGIGALVSQDPETGIISIVRVFSGSPAEEAGMLGGDVIFKVDDNEVTGMDLNLMVNNYIRGLENTQVVVTVYRENEKEYKDLTITRRVIDVETVTHKMLDDHIGLVTVMQFDLVTDKQFKEAVDDLQKEGMEKLIVDLRDNPGGEVNTVVSMVDYLLEDKGTIMSIADKKGRKDVYSTEDGHSVQIPTAVLVNGNSASASEIFTGALQDYGAATVIGTQTFGKGIMQTLFTLDNGGGVKLTTDHYYTPGGNDLHGTGVTPDIVVELDEEVSGLSVIPEEKDNQLKAAVDFLKKQN